MKPVNLAIAGMIAAGAMFGAVAASAAPLPATGTVVVPGASQVVPAGYRCWWRYGRRHCRWWGGYYHPYYHRHYYRYHY